MPQERFFYYIFVIGLELEIKIFLGYFDSKTFKKAILNKFIIIMVILLKEYNYKFLDY